MTGRIIIDLGDAIDRHEVGRPAAGTSLAKAGEGGSATMQRLRMACVAVCVLSAMYVINFGSQSSRMMSFSSSGNDDERLSALFSPSSSSSSYYYHHHHHQQPESFGAKNELLKTFERVMSNATLHISGSYDSYVPFILNDDGRALCRRSHLDVISKTRVNSFLEMISLGMQLRSNGNDDAIFSYNIPTTLDVNNDHDDRRRRWAGLPIISLEGDGSGCFHRNHGIFQLGHDDHGPFHGNGPVDRLPFPRLAWHTPSHKHGSGWCHAIGMPGYEPWRMIRDLGISGRYSWNRRFVDDARRYPRRKKTNKAAWRGSTTGFFYPTFDDLPRSKLVKEGNMHSDLFDVGFTSFVMGWEKQAKEIRNQTTVKGYISLDDLMRYRAIIDIDGNTWSSRFSKLLCTNSVVIKVRIGGISNRIVVRRVSSSLTI